MLSKLWRHQGARRGQQVCATKHPIRFRCGSALKRSRRRGLIARKHIVVALCALAVPLGSCASYRPVPLGPDAAATLQTTPAALAAAAARFEHPILTPVYIDFGKPLTADMLAILAVVGNPDLQAARKRAGVSAAQVFAARLMPDPAINLSYDRRLSGPDPFDALAGQLVYELTALRDQRVANAAARATADQVHFDIAWQEWQTAEQAKLLAARISGLSETVELLAAAKADEDDIVARMMRAVARGDLSSESLELRRLTAAQLTSRLRQAERDLSTTQFDLTRLLGLPPETRIALAGFIPPAREWHAKSLLDDATSHRLDLRALEAGYVSQEAVVHKAVLDQFPKLQLTVSRAQDTAFNQTVGPAVSFILPLWNRNRGGIAIAEATRAQLRAEYAARVFGTRADIATLVGGLALARAQRDEAARPMPSLERLVASSDAAVRRGDMVAPAASALRQSLFEKKILLAALDQSIAEQTVALELSVGHPLAWLER